MEKDKGYRILRPKKLRQWMDEDRGFVLIDTLPKEIYDKRRFMFQAGFSSIRACIWSTI